jgi:murein DD-endopeptidase MepM/ murein hydrolase activator NlpD
MKWISTFLIGALFGACALFFFLRSEPADGTLELPAGAVASSGIAQPVLVAPDAAAALPAAAAVPAAPPLSVPDAAPAIPASAAPPAIPAAAAEARDAFLLIPVAGVKAGQLMDTYDQARGQERRHEALDILAPLGTRVVAAADGRVAKLFNSKPGGLTLYQFDATEKFAYYYAHLERYASGVTEGMLLKRGDLIGYVGATGNADPAAPHLHFAVFTLTPEKKWWQGAPLNPYPLMQP